MNKEERERLFRRATWLIKVCPVCAAKYPHHQGECLDEEPGLREYHVLIRVVSETYRIYLNSELELLGELREAATEVLRIADRQGGAFDRLHTVLDSLKMNEGGR